MLQFATAQQQVANLRQNGADEASVENCSEDSEVAGDGVGDRARRKQWGEGHVFTPNQLLLRGSVRVHAFEHRAQNIIRAHASEHRAQKLVVGVGVVRATPPTPP
eukprot:COSAG06_NODE_4400_length_4296_cov_2.428878_2_plen_105_part_00